MITHRGTRSALACGMLAAVTILAACSGGSGPPAGASSPAAAGGRGAHGAAVIVIRNFAFSPASLTVRPGERVTVRNADQTTHTLTDKADPALFSTGDIRPGQSKTFTAPARAGRYPYICLIHQFMAGTLVVS